MADPLASLLSLLSERSTHSSRPHETLRSTLHHKIVFFSRDHQAFKSQRRPDRRWQVSFSPIKSPLAAACVRSACRQLTLFGCRNWLTALLEPGSEVTLSSLGVTKVPRRAFLECGLRRCHVCEPAEASSTLAVLPSRPFFAREGSMGYVPSALSEAG